MRLIKCTNIIAGGNDILLVDFTESGTSGRLPLEKPGSWDTLTRAQKIAWLKAQCTAALPNGLYNDDGDVIYPDQATQESNNTDFENLPGWSTWTATQAESWIDTNVTDLASAKTALKAMAKAIVYLRNYVMPQ